MYGRNYLKGLFFNWQGFLAVRLGIASTCGKSEVCVIFISFRNLINAFDEMEGGTIPQGQVSLLHRIVLKKGQGGNI